MSKEYLGLSQINGPLIVIEGVEGAAYEELAEIKMENGEKRFGRIIEVSGDRAVVQVFEGTSGMSLSNNSTLFKGHPLEMPLSKELLGRVFDGAGRPKDGLGEIYPIKKQDVNGNPINPVSREYPRNFIQTGVSSIDALVTLIRGQKLPIFSGSGMSHNQLAVQIVRQAQIADENNADFAVVFAAMGVK